MSRYQGVIIAGFGGQGILSIGKILAQAGMAEGMNVSWLPSYGPEIRGGTAYCHVILSDDAIGSPLLDRATAFIAMNKPSYEKYVGMVVDGGLVIVDGSLIDAEPGSGAGFEFHSIPATKTALDNGNAAFANIILAGKLLARTGVVSARSFEAALGKVLSKRYRHLIPKEMEMLKLGMEI
ncbi:MAG: 2-oxoacid:acceptor oxidoreductase family protein [Clostridiales bacterium]|jgi:2-oxoglutarate ferredoxin oxidoreductase subunit gamma|nr:2-oxoacid:acceptor oxidoreductase family protein [Clostridiales bacterium]